MPDRSTSTNTSESGLTTLQGQVERVTFHNDETDFTIARLKVPGYRDLVTVVRAPSWLPTPGQVVRATGEWINHPKFGEQFKILRYTTLVPATVAGMEKYLGSGLIKGIGPVMAKRMVKQFGEDTLKVIEEDSEKLLEVEGIGNKRVTMIAKGLGGPEGNPRGNALSFKATASARPTQQRSSSNTASSLSMWCRKIPTGWPRTFSA